MDKRYQLLNEEQMCQTLLFGRDPLEGGLRQLVEEAALEVVARLAVQHARLRMAQVQALAGTGDGHVHQAAFFFQAAFVADGVFVREQALLHAADEHGVKFQPLAGVHGHQLHGVPPGLGLVVAASSAAWVRKAARARGFRPCRCPRCRGSLVSAARPAGCVGVQALAHGTLPQRRSVLVQRQGHGIAAKTFLRDKALGGVDEFLQVFDAVLAFFRCGSAPPIRRIQAPAQ